MDAATSLMVVKNWPLLTTKFSPFKSHQYSSIAAFCAHTTCFYNIFIVKINLAKFTLKSALKSLINFVGS